MVFTWSQYANKSKEELIQKLNVNNSSFVTWHQHEKKFDEAEIPRGNLEEKFNDFLSKYNSVNSELQQYKKLNSHLLTRTIQLEHNVVTNSQYSRRETIELNPVPADITEDVLEENIYKTLSLTGVNVVPNDLHAYHQMKRTDRVIVKFKCRKQKHNSSW